MKPDWDKLMTEFKGHATILVADVDCTTAGKPLCDSNGVKGFPTIKWGAAGDLEDYSGGRDFGDLQKFAAGLKPVCSVAAMDLCDDEQKAKIEAVQAMSVEDIDTAIAEAEAKGAAAEKLFEDELAKLQATYKQLQEDKDTALAEVKASGVGTLKSVKAAKEAAPTKEEL
jgi:hypothetical protein